MDEETLETQIGLADSVRVMLGIDSPPVFLDDEVVLSTDPRWRKRWAVGHIVVSALLRGEAEAAARITHGFGTVSAVAIAVRMLHQGTLLDSVPGSSAVPARRDSPYLSILEADASASPAGFAAGLRAGARLAEEFWPGGGGPLPLLPAVCDRCAPLAGPSRRAATASILQRYADAMSASSRRDPLELADEQCALATAVMGFNVIRWSDGHIRGT